MKLKKTLALLLAAAFAVTAPLALTSCGDTGYNLPIVCGETNCNDLCGVATLGVDYYNLGVAAGNMAADILLNGTSPATIAVGSDPTPALSINETVAAEIGFAIPDAVKSGASGAQTTAVTRKTGAIKDSGADFTVGILQLVQHPALDKSNQGFVDQLSVRMDAAGKSVKILDQNASGDVSTATTIANTLNGTSGMNLIYAIATPAAQAAMTATQESKIPVIFNAVTDPVGAGLVASWDAPGGNVTGISDINPVAEQIKLIGDLLGKDDVKVGLLFTSSETNSVFQIGLAKTACTANGFTFVEKGIADINDLPAALSALNAAGVDAIYIPTDNALASAAATVHALNLGK